MNTKYRFIGLINCILPYKHLLFSLRHLKSGARARSLVSQAMGHQFKKNTNNGWIIILVKILWSTKLSKLLKYQFQRLNIYKKNLKIK